MIWNKRGAGPLVIVLLAIIAALVIVWVSGLVQRECSKDTDCPQDYYCGSDFQCHEQKIIDRTVVHNYNLLGASIVIGIALIICALILKSRRIQHILGL
ncbi:MAG TPA: hypothetical protein VJK52_00055 [Candidatus Nanoarchaeia archaeon]|nr:hypothetical protein [Candidatus Nanoarchaeia archaeon]